MSISASRRKCQDLIDKYYSDVDSRKKILDNNISKYIRNSDVLLDAGCGSDFPLLTQYSPNVSMALGVDLLLPSVQVSGNIKVLLGNLNAIPIQSNSVDIIISHSVFEHLLNPFETFHELSRVLRTGGKLVFTTPNKYYYSCLLAHLIPESLKDYYFKTVFGEDAFDHFRVYYRANSITAFKRLAKSSNFRIKKIEPIRHYPYYLMFSTILFRFGVYYDKIITALGLKWLQSNWLVVMEKD